MHKRVLAALLASSCAAAAVYAPPALAQAGDTDPREYDIAEQPLGDALREFARISGREVVADARVLEDRRGNRVQGQLPAEEALRRLLAGSGFTAEVVGGAFVLRIERGTHAAASDGLTPPILVVGTRIRGQQPVGSPVVTLDRTDIERSGLGTVQDLLQAIPQAFGGGQNEATLGASTRNGAGTNGGYGSSINLRGLGASSTLVLIDGNRPALGGLGGVFADLSLIPVNAIERIEVMTDGASAIYGADAVAGVVNIRLRNRFEGAETMLRVGTADGAMGSIQLGQLLGKRWDRGDLVLAYQFHDRGRLPASARPFATEDLRPFGGPDYRSQYGVPGTIIAADGTTFAIPGGQDGRALDPAALVAGTANLHDVRAATDIVPSQRTHSFYTAGSLSLGETSKLSASALAARRSYEKVALPETDTAVAVPVTNPFYVDPIGTNEPVTVRYSFADELGPQIDRGRVSGLTAAADFEHSFGAWRIHVGGTYGRQHERRTDLNVPNRARMALALADTDPATALNVFGDGSGNNPATLGRIRGSRVSTTRFDSHAAALRADGPLFRLPAGEVQLALGAEYRREKYDAHSRVDIGTLAPVERDAPELPGPRHIRSAYAELLIPIFGEENAMPGLRHLDVSLAGRIEDYSDVGRTTNPKLGVIWEPAEGIRLRGSYGTSFRPPSFEELIGPTVSLYLATIVADPRAPGGQANVLALFGYAPDIRPERATTWTAGIDLTPSLIPHSRASLTYYDVNYRDRIGTATQDFASFLSRRDIFGGLIDEPPSPERVAFYYAAPTFSNPLGIAPSAITAILDGQVRNLSAVHQTGLDVEVGYTPPLAGGRLDLGVMASHIFEIDQQLAPGAPFTDVVGTFAHPVEWRARGRAGWSRGGFSATAHVNHTAGYTNQIPAVPERVDSWTTFDLQLAQRIEDLAGSRDLQLALSILNLFDSGPPYVNNKTITSALAYDPEKADAAGRTISLQATIQW